MRIQLIDKPLPPDSPVSRLKLQKIRINADSKLLMKMSNEQVQGQE
jgi:hypothetical protein